MLPARRGPQRPHVLRRGENEHTPPPPLPLLSRRAHRRTAMVAVQHVARRRPTGAGIECVELVLKRRFNGGQGMQCAEATPVFERESGTGHAVPGPRPVLKPAAVLR